MKAAKPGPGAFEWMGVQYHTVLHARDTGGALSITESVSPAGSGPPRHVHDDADECFVILSGDVDFLLAGERVAKGPGDTVFVPRGTDHTFHVSGERPARMLTILTPGGFEAFFAEMASRHLTIPHDMTEITRIAADYSLQFTGPPMGPDKGEGN